MMSSLGVYFGPTLISIVETKGKRLLNHIQMPYSSISGGELEEKVPDEIKIVALFKDELRRNKITAKEVSLVLSGRDLIVRAFEIPVLPREELSSAVNFEVKKYIPFKVEDLISDFQIEFDKSSRKNIVLFAGIKKEIMEEYFSILSQLDLKINSMEYAGFSVLRLLKLTGISAKGIIAMLCAEFQEEDEVNFTVLENGFPLFSRDITLLGGPEEIAQTEEIESGMILEKLKTEIRVSLDYYHRKFPTKNIEKIFFISGPNSRSDLETFVKELGLSSQFIDVDRHLGKPIPFSLSFIKGYSGALSKTIKTPLKIDLLSAKAKARPIKEAAIPEGIVSLVTGLKIEPKIVVLALLICIATFVFGLYQKLPLEKELNSIIGMRPKVSTVGPDANYEELSGISAEYRKKIETLDNLTEKQLYLAQLLDAIPRLIPEGIWLVNFSFKNELDKAELTLDGRAYLANSEKELELVNNFLVKLKEDSIFAKYFKEIAINSLNTGSTGKTSVTNFVISCSSFYKEKE